MAVIKISELRPAGSELFQDSETFLTELNAQEISDVLGGVIASQISQTLGSVASQNSLSGGVISASVGVTFSFGQ